MAWLILVLLLVSIGARSDAIRCFECQSVPFPYDCARVTECNKGEYCFTEQVVTTSGNVVYNSGCLQKERCAAVAAFLIGKRSKVPSKRVTDLSTCVECCTDSFCNMKGCGISAIPPEQRGPYCFSCDAVLDPRSCEMVAVCLQNEVCLLYSPSEFRGLPETLYRSHCGRQTKCAENLQPLSSGKCAVTCCSGDFCNNQCVSSLSNSTSSQPPTLQSTDTTKYAEQTTDYNPTTTDSRTTKTELQTTTRGTTFQSSTQTSTTKAPFHCNSHGGYISIHNSHAHLCVHIVIRHLSWDDARSECKHEGGDLVVLDTREKASLMRSTLLHNKDYDHTSYWIGLRDFSNHNHFHWIDNSPYKESQTDWGHGEPDHHTNHYNTDCVVMERGDSFKWHDKACSEFQGRDFICERK